ncbi:MAG: NifB/NifX family molybdenum-iron cluster-binding protein [Bacteroidales bacterium]|nr:NifB/NifX family molybdenum-iron cluster-binding protein [Bacteroidales bacterium]
MKIAIPTTGTKLDHHFGHCESYTVMTVDDDKNIIESEILPATAGCGCKSDIASVLKEKGVTIMLAGNMGTGAANILGQHGIEVYRGCSGNVRALAEAFLAGAIYDSGSPCAQHELHQQQGRKHGHQYA